MRAVNDSLTPRGIDPLFRGELGSGFSDSTRACAYGKRLAEIQEWLATPFVPRTRIFIRPHYMLCLGVKGSGGGYQRFGLIWGVDMQDPGYELRRIPLLKLSEKPRKRPWRGPKERCEGSFRRISPSS
jgi:hypothetical protein